MSRDSHYWDAASCARLRRLVRAKDSTGEPKYSYGDIGARFGLSRNAVISKAKRLGLGGDRGSPIKSLRSEEERERSKRRHLFANLNPTLLLGTLGPFPHVPMPSFIPPAPTCQYPTGDSLPYSFNCKEPSKPGTSWCYEHFALTHMRKN